MKVSQTWLKKYIDFKLKPEQFVEGLTMLGLEVESYEDLGKKFDKFVVGEVLERARHPNADRLTVCKVNVGPAVQEIVCGAPNVAAGQKVAVALVGATIPHNQHDPEGNPFTLGRAKIRGVESNGMICSAFELGLGKDADGILVLEPEAKVGTPLARHLRQNDIVYEIGITPNRADCLSHIGVAREVALLVNKKVTLPSISLKESSVPASKYAAVKVVDKDGCPRYSARVLRNAKIHPSPRWLQDLLTSVGVRPVNNVVDVTNYVLLEYGHPLHAFDYDKLASHTIVVRKADGGKFTTLDGKERTLTSETLMICDGERPVAIAGVMGGMNSEISDSTTNILIESAYFNPRSIRRTSKFLGLSTEASYRFERGADSEITVVALNRAAQMMQELTGAEVLKGVIDAYPKKRKAQKIKLRVSRTNAILGTSLQKNEVSKLLGKIGVDVRSGSAEALTATPPSFRNDLTTEIDLIEEVARVYGYDNIETKTRAAIDFSHATRVDRWEDDLRSHLVGSGFNEILAISLQDEKTVALPGKAAVRVLNPVSTDMQALRTSLVPGALQVVQHNKNHGTRNLRLFEIGRVFSLKEGKNPELLDAYEEDERLLVLISGATGAPSYGTVQREVDLLDLKGELDALLAKFCLDKYRFIYYDNRSALTDLAIGVEINGTYAGSFGKVKQELADRFDIEDRVFVCELEVQVLRRGGIQERKYATLPRYPAVSRDLAFSVDQSASQLSVEEVIRESGSPLLRQVVLFDVYVGEQAGQGKKSLAYALEFQSQDHTLTDTEIERVLAQIVENVQRRCGAVLRRS
ncbi:MAG: phenylalanine--tRNA ligase subunit beta [Bacteroidota bacterium]